MYVPPAIQAGSAGRLERGHPLAGLEVAHSVVEVEPAAPVVAAEPVEACLRAERERVIGHELDDLDGRAVDRGLPWCGELEGDVALAGGVRVLPPAQRREGPVTRQVGQVIRARRRREAGRVVVRIEQPPAVADEHPQLLELLGTRSPSFGRLPIEVGGRRRWTARGASSWISRSAACSAAGSAPDITSSVSSRKHGAGRSETAW